jgi:hypothetical protein
MEDTSNITKIYTTTYKTPQENLVVLFMAMNVEQVFKKHLIKAPLIMFMVFNLDSRKLCK